MKSTLTIVQIIISSVLFYGCAMTPPVTTAQKRSLQMRTYEQTSYENVFRAFKTVLQDDGYVIKNQDLQGGLITGIIQKSKSTTHKVFGLDVSTSDETDVRGGGNEASVNLEKVSNSVTEVRVVFQRTTSYEKGGDTGEEVLDPEAYKTFFRKAQVEIERRKAQGKDAASTSTLVRPKAKKK